MKCPYCAKSMDAGKIEVHSGYGTFFVSASGKEDVFKMTSRDAFQCGDCATVIIKGRFASDDEHADLTSDRGV